MRGRQVLLYACCCMQRRVSHVMIRSYDDAVSADGRWFGLTGPGRFVEICGDCKVLNVIFTLP